MTDKPSRLWEIANAYKPGEALRAEAVALRARMVSELGEPAARQLWAEVGDVTPGRIPGSGGKYDALFRLAYDDTASRPDFIGWKREQIAHAVAVKLFDVAEARGEPARYGASVDAITKAIKRALERREKQRRLQAGIGTPTFCPCCLKPSWPHGLPPDKKGGE